MYCVLGICITVYGEMVWWNVFSSFAPTAADGVFPRDAAKTSGDHAGDVAA